MSVKGCTPNSEAQDGAEEGAVLVDPDQIRVVHQLIPPELITAVDPEGPRQVILNADLAAEDAVSLQPEDPDVVVDVDPLRRVNVHVVTYRPDQFSERARAFSVGGVRHGAQVNAGRGETSLSHRPDPDFLIPPAIGVRGQEHAQALLGPCVEVGGVGSVPEDYRAAERPRVTRSGAGVVQHELVLAALRPANITQPETELVLQAEIVLERDGRTGRGGAREIHLAAGDRVDAVEFDFILRRGGLGARRRPGTRQDNHTDDRPEKRSSHTEVSRRAPSGLTGPMPPPHVKATFQLHGGSAEA